MKKKILLFFVLLWVLLMIPGKKNLFAGEINALVDKLVEKNVISQDEAQVILEKTTKKEEKPSNIAESLPAWVQTLKLKGDLRTRIQEQEIDDNSYIRERARIRFRLGVQAKVSDQVKVGFGLATGSGDPRSTNQTLEDTFEKKTINLDYAYAQYTPASWLDIYGGKLMIQDALWAPAELVWDSDLAPEGITCKLSLLKATGIDTFLNTSYFILEEVSSGTDPSLVIVQPGLVWKVNQALELKSTVNYYAFNSLEGGTVLEYAKQTNTLAANRYKYDYDAWGFSSELGMNTLIFKFINYTAFFVDYIHNPDPEQEDSGYLLGIKFGDKLVNEAKKWQVKYMYRKLEKDACPDFLPESDFYDGKTGVKGDKVTFEYGLLKNVSLALNYYHSQNIEGVKKRENLSQIDFTIKF